MRIKATPEDFLVDEQIRLSLVPSGQHAVYRVRKRGVTTLEVQQRMATALRIGKERIAFPALKDKEAVATQYVSVLLGGGDGAPRQGAPLATIAEREFEAEPIGYAARRLQPADLRGNRFSVVVRDLTLTEAQALRPRLRQAGTYGVPNYFDAQRFGSFAGDSGFIGKKILKRDAEGALRIYLSSKMVGDPERVRVFKEYAQAHWGEWAAMMEHAPKPSNFRSVLTYLIDHPSDFRRALNLVPHRLLTLYLSAYQSWLWNRIAGRYIASALAGLQFATRCVRVGGVDLPVYFNLPESLRLTFERLQLPLPNHRAIYREPEIARVAGDVLAEEQLTLNDFKARILKKAFAAKSSRALIVRPEEIVLGDPELDELARKRWKLTLQFVLAPGSYATLLIKALAAQDEEHDD